MDLADLREDVVAQLKPGSRAVLEQVIAEYGASDTFAFLLALAAASTRRERQVLRVFLRQLDEVPEEPAEAAD